MNEMEITKICAVCGDKAIARNFCALTCESCKAFFRRNASKINEFSCIYGNDCVIDLDTRKRCRKCRLNKCFIIGMRKEWILNEEEKRVRNNKIQENRKNKSENEWTDIVMASNLDMINDLTIDSDICQILEDSHSENNSLDNNYLNESSEKTTTNQNYYKNDLINCCTELVPIMRPLTDYSNNFTETEGNYLTELLNAVKSATISKSGIYAKINTYSEAMHYISHKWDEGVRQSIKSAKSLRAFKSIGENDKISLFRYNSGVIELMKCIACYQKQNEYWNLVLDPNNAFILPLDVFRQNSIEEYEQCKLCINKLASLWDSDRIILHLLLSIVLFMSNRPQLTDRSQIRLKQQIYIHLLKRYLQLKYRSETESMSRLLKLMEVISDFEVFHEQQLKRFLVKSSPNYFYFSGRPLLKELFDNDSQT